MLPVAYAGKVIGFYLVHSLERSTDVAFGAERMGTITIYSYSSNWLHCGQLELMS